MSAVGAVLVRPVCVVTVPSGLRVTSISPRTIRVAFDRRVEKVVEIQPQLVGRPMHGYVVSELRPLPTTVKVRGAERALKILTAVRTQEISVDGRAETFSTERFRARFAAYVETEWREFEGRPQEPLQLVPAVSARSSSRRPS